MDVQASLGLHFAGLQKSVDGIDQRVRDYITAQNDKYRGVKHFRLPLMQGTVAGAAFSIGELSGVVCGPEEGYAWAIRRLLVTGLARGATPDVAQLFRSSSAQQGGFLWEFNGNNFGYTFGKGELSLMPGDRLQLNNFGAITAAAGTQITLQGEVDETPAEMFAKLLVGG
jgi:hypothetical protein